MFVQFSIYPLPPRQDWEEVARQPRQHAPGRCPDWSQHWTNTRSTHQPTRVPTTAPPTMPMRAVAFNTCHCFSIRHSFHSTPCNTQLALASSAPLRTPNPIDLNERHADQQQNLLGVPRVHWDLASVPIADSLIKAQSPPLPPTAIPFFPLFFLSFTNS